MAYAIIRTGGKQYRVEPGETIRVEKLPGEVGSDIEFDEVLLRSTDDGLAIGAPLVEDAKVGGRIIEQDKSRKVLVFHKKRRKTYKKIYGHRQPYTAVRIDSVA
ncbi:MAG: 50S ribosomal protein L21 [Deltaproteobacteria bacterium]